MRLSAAVFGGALALAAPAGAQTLFTDVTDTALPAPFIHAGAGVDVFGELVAPNLGGDTTAVLTWIGGVVIADFNGDGWNDIFVANGAGNPDLGLGVSTANALYLNNGDGALAFTEVAAAAGVDSPSDESASAVAADFDGDGDLDLYVSTVGLGLGGPFVVNMPNRLFLNQGNDSDGVPQFIEVAGMAGAQGDPQARYQQPSAVDFNRDGDLDIYVAAHTPIVVPVGRSDLPLCEGPPNPFCFAFKRPESQTSILLENRMIPDGTLTFVDATDLLRNADGAGATGADGRPIFNSMENFDSVWVDYNNDGWPDLIQANDLNVIGLFRNNGGTGFTYLSPESGFVYTGAYMAMAPGDINGDGNIDIYATNVGKATSLPPFQPAFGGTKYYVLHLNQGGPDPAAPVFTEVAGDVATEAAFPDVSLANPRVGNDTSGDFGWGANMFDYDNDGDLDILSLGNWFAVGLGYRGIPDGIVDFETLPVDPAVDIPGHNNPGHLFRNDGTDANGNPILVDLSNDIGEAQDVVGIYNPWEARGMAVGDLNNDGFEDVVVVNPSGVATSGEAMLFPPSTAEFVQIGTYTGALRIYKNNGVGNNRSLTLRLKGTQKNTRGIGARVRVRVGQTTQVREMWSNAGHLGGLPSELVIGLGKKGSTASIEIDWPSGVKQVVTGIPLNGARHQIIEIVEAEGRSSHAARN